MINKKILEIFYKNTPSELLELGCVEEEFFKKICLFFINIKKLIFKENK